VGSQNSGVRKGTDNVLKKGCREGQGECTINFAPREVSLRGKEKAPKGRKEKSETPEGHEQTGRIIRVNEETRSLKPVVGRRSKISKRQKARKRRRKADITLRQGPKINKKETIVYKINGEGCNTKGESKAPGMNNARGGKGSPGKKTSVKPQGTEGHPRTGKEGIGSRTCKDKKSDLGCTEWGTKERGKSSKHKKGGGNETQTQQMEGKKGEKRAISWRWANKVPHGDGRRLTEGLRSSEKKIETKRGSWEKNERKCEQDGLRSLGRGARKMKTIGGAFSSPGDKRESEKAGQGGYITVPCDNRRGGWKGGQ